jgi:hypothetical protein
VAKLDLAFLNYVEMVTAVAFVKDKFVLLLGLCREAIN